MSEATIAVGAGGATTWERMCLGLPSIVVSVAANQEAAAQDLAEADLQVYLGPAQSVSAADYRRAAEILLGDVNRREDLAERGRALVDGRGVDRVIRTLFS
jgi:spore coat polysaccharide biosynthesis predicted glycosyltransferase SpsG